MRITCFEGRICFFYIIPAKPLHNRDIASIHFNHFYCMGICHKLNWHLSMLIKNEFNEIYSISKVIVCIKMLCSERNILLDYIY